MLMFILMLIVVDLERSRNHINTCGLEQSPMIVLDAPLLSYVRRRPVDMGCCPRFSAHRRVAILPVIRDTVNCLQVFGHCIL